MRPSGCGDQLSSVDGYRRGEQQVHDPVLDLVSGVCERLGGETDSFVNVFVPIDLFPGQQMKVQQLGDLTQTTYIEIPSTADHTQG